MNVTQQWKVLFHEFGIKCQETPGNPNAIQLSNMAGCPIFRGVTSVSELNDLHTKARERSSHMNRLLILGLPLTHSQSVLTLPGNILLPKVRAYGGHNADTFSLSGHRIEPLFLKKIKAETIAVIKNGTDVKSPLCDWVLKLLGTNWHYGKPSSLAELDSMLALLISEPNAIGHVRARQLSFGRGCADATLLPVEGIKLKNNSLDQKIAIGDFRFIGLESELEQLDAVRNRIYPLISDKFLTALGKIDSQFAKDMGCGVNVGASIIGRLEVKVPSGAPTPQRSSETRVSTDAAQYA